MSAIPQVLREAIIEEHEWWHRAYSASVRALAVTPIETCANDVCRAFVEASRSTEQAPASVRERPDAGSNANAGERGVSL